ncbi:sulfatase-like hydrolase/transferase [Akkermansiaceae bacterium]|nr:sulfatase-like hydrolase/transferase [Akkermansiaceae bacterium]
MNFKKISSSLAFFALAASSEAIQKPNIVLIMADDLGWFDTHFQGNEALDTPFLDQFVTEGILFPHGYAAAPVCTPTRAAMMTGIRGSLSHCPRIASSYCSR